MEGRKRRRRQATFSTQALICHHERSRFPVSPRAVLRPTHWWRASRLAAEAQTSVTHPKSLSGETLDKIKLQWSLWEKFQLDSRLKRLRLAPDPDGIARPGARIVSAEHPADVSLPSQRPDTSERKLKDSKLSFLLRSLDFVHCHTVNDKKNKF